jgi:glycosyltransferase involved in cell wall biosynthesis
MIYGHVGKAAKEGEVAGMKIGIEMRHVTFGAAGGIAMLLKGVLRSMFERYPQHRFICFTTIFNRDLFGHVPANVEFSTIPLFSYFEDIDRQCDEKKIDVLFRGYPVEQQINFPLRRQVVQIPDIQHEYLPDFFDEESLGSRRRVFSQALSEAGAIGTVSEFARQSLLEQPCTRCRDIFLMSPALQIEHQQQEELTSAECAQIPEGDFFLFPANLWQHKNHKRVLQAFARLHARFRIPVQFLFTGHPDGWEKYQERFGYLPIRHLGFVRPVLVRKLLEKARALVYFSLYEGFGIPLLEAFDAGTPVLCSNTTSLPEVGGDAVLSCDPTDVESISGLMVRIIRERGLRRELVRGGKKRLKAYTWEESADNLMAAFERVAQRAEESRNEHPARIDVKQLPRVAIVTPACNQASQLKQTIESVLGQNYSHVDYIVVDGNSKDNSAEILRSYGNRLKWIVEPDMGSSQAINKGFARTNGEFRAYLNAGIMLLPGAVQKAVNHFLTHPDCDLVFENSYPNENDRISVEGDTTEFSFDHLHGDSCSSQPVAFWRSEIAKRVGPFDELLKLAMDYDYWLRIDRASGGNGRIQALQAIRRIQNADGTLAQQAQFYHEIIHVCIKNASYVSLSHYEGLWQCRSRDKSIFPHDVLSLPFVPHILSRMHYFLDKGIAFTNQHKLLDPASSFGMCMRNLLKRFLAPSKCQGPSSPKEHAKSLPAPSEPKTFDGVWSDNWIGASCQVRLKDNSVGHQIQLTGTPNEPMQLTVAVNDKPVKVFQLRGQHLEEIQFQVEPGQEREVVLHFSKHVVDTAGRRLSFRLQGSNLFSEQDLQNLVG